MPPNREAHMGTGHEGNIGFDLDDAIGNREADRRGVDEFQHQGIDQLPRRHRMLLRPSLRIQRDDGGRDDKVHGAILASVDDDLIEVAKT